MGLDTVYRLHMLRLSEKEFEDTASFRDPKAEKVIRILHAMKLENMLADTEGRLEFIRNLNFQSFKNFLVRINGIVRGLPIKGRDFEKEDVVFDGFGFRSTPPDPEDREELLKEVFEQARQCRTLADIAFLLSTSINAVHPFSDGNGRTSRLVFLLVQDGYGATPKEDQKVRRVLGEGGRREIDTNPLLIRGEVLKVLKARKDFQSFESPTLPDSIGKYIREMVIPGVRSEEKKERFIRMIEDGSTDFGLIAVFRYLADKGYVSGQFFKVVPDTSLKILHPETGKVMDNPNPPDKIVISLHDVLKILTDKDVDEILEYNREAKKEYIRLLADVIVNPERYLFPDASGWNDYTNLKEYYMFNIFMRNKNFFEGINPVKGTK